MRVLQETLFGGRLPEGQPQKPDEKPVVDFGSFGLTEKQLSKHVLCIGGTGSGKTNAIYLMLSQIRAQMTKDDVMIIFDTKGDFAGNFFDGSRGDIILGNSSAMRGKSVRWNIFGDILADGTDERDVTLNINEISRALFERNESAQQPFFPNAARGVFGAYLLSAIREADGNFKGLDNFEIVDFFAKAGKRHYKAISDSAPDMRFIDMYLGDFDNPQALGVLAEIQVMLKDTFIGVFAEKGEFSMRSFIRGKSGRTLFLEYDLSVGETLTPLYSLLIDLALKEAMSQSGQAGGRVYVVLDELKLLPKVKHLDDAVNFGRSLGVRTLAGLQSMAQLYDMYGENKGKAIAAGFSTLMAFRPNDALTREYAQSHFGRNITAETVSVGVELVTERREGHIVEDWDLNSLVLGQAVIGMDATPPFLYQFSEYSGKKT